MLTFHIVGAGLSGAVLARELVNRFHSRVIVYDERMHVAGNCHGVRDEKTQVMTHIYGPHIFNTNSKCAWDYICRFVTLIPYINRVKASIDRGVFSFPINLHTINQYFGTRFSPGEAEAYIKQKRERFQKIGNFEEMALASIGRELYEAFVCGYTKKQWGVDPRELPSSVFKRLPIRFNYNDNYYSAAFQGLPKEGYTKLVERILDHDEIKVELGVVYDRSMTSKADYVFYTGCLDAYFSRSEGALGYRTVYWERIESSQDILGNAVVNFPGLDVPYTRISEHNYFSPWEVHSQHLAFREFSVTTTSADIPYYPTRLPRDLIVAKRYQELAFEEDKVSFLGRLGTYRYLNMDKVINEALELAIRFSAWWEAGRQEGRPVFSTLPVDLMD